ncbi:MAG: chloride channel protein [Planctomycetes bacterium]|nr:chloride channel protein [Planctomycetota bacterium]
MHSEEKQRFSHTPARLALMALWSLATGILAGLAARALDSSLAFGIPRLIGTVARPQDAAFLLFDWRLLAMPAAGGLVSGLVVTFLCRPMKAHGTAILIDAFHNHGGRLALRDAVFKALAAVGVISLGGSVGKEAVIAVLCAAIGAGVADALGMSRRQRRVLLVAGCGAGVGAIFKCPLGGALFACTVLYREPDIEADGLMPSIIASVTAYSVFVSIGGMGHRLLSGTGSLTFSRPSELPAFVLLGLACAVAGVVFSLAIRGVARTARALRVPAWLAPMAAGLLVGAATGAALAAALPGVFPESLREAMIPVGMAGMLSASLRVPLAAVVMVMEMTGSYGLIVPLMLTSVAAYAVGRRWGVYPEQVAGLENSPAHAGEALVSRLDTLRVADFLRASWPHVVQPADTVQAILTGLPAGPTPLLAVGARP